MKKLQLTFLNEAGKKHRLVPTAVNEKLTAETVREKMDAICALGIFEKEGTRLYEATDSAKYVETIETPLF